MKEEYGSGFDGTPEQALKYAQDTPGQELEVKRLVKIIRKVVKDKYNGRTCELTDKYKDETPGQSIEKKRKKSKKVIKEEELGNPKKILRTKLDIPRSRGTLSQRYNNPGAQYPDSPSALYFQGTGVGKGGGHKVMGYKNPTSGAAANMYTLATGKNFGGREARTGKPNPTMDSALEKWRGVKNTPFDVPEVPRNTKLDDKLFLNKDAMRNTMKNFAQHEAGKKDPFKNNPIDYDKAYNKFRNIYDRTSMADTEKKLGKEIEDRKTQEQMPPVPARNPTREIPPVPARNPTREIPPVPARKPTREMPPVPTRKPTKEMPPVPTRKPNSIG